MDIKKAESFQAIGFDCAYCGEINYESDNLERGEDVDGCAAESDTIACSHCGEDNFVYRKI